MRVQLSDRWLEIRLSPIEKALGLMRDITVSRSAITEVRVLDEPLREVMRAGLKVGLRLPWLYYVCRTIRLDQAWAVRRGVPALSVAVRDQGVLEHVTVSTPEASELARQLGR
ncbi:MAG TPA: hypothetical protein VFR48_00420 [Solirubrobacteraceae bacterium]|nr:hypothetical protein [Solirubrobacteraceae bacterium]